MNLYDGLKRYYEIAGIRGVAAIARHRLTGHPTEIEVRPQCVREPLTLRLRTTDVFTYQEVLIDAEYDFDLHFTPRTILDVGANIGMVSLYFAHKYPEAKIIAVEAEASNFEILVRNVERYPAITPLHAALWKYDGSISVSQPSEGAVSHWAFTTHEGVGSPVRAITMETLMREMQWPTIDVLKVDIEGAEKEVFDRCNWMHDVTCLMIELHDRFKPGCSDSVDAVAVGFDKSQRGFTTFYRRPHDTASPVA